MLSCYSIICIIILFVYVDSILTNEDFIRANQTYEKVYILFLKSFFSNVTSILKGYTMFKKSMDDGREKH